MKPAYFTKLNIGGLSFITDEFPTNATIVDFLNAHQPPHVYTNARIKDYCIVCNIMGNKYEL